MEQPTFGDIDIPVRRLLSDPPPRADKRTQKEFVLDQLRERGTVCGTWFLQFHIPRYSARIYDLIQDGHRIVRVPCPHHYHTNPASIASYRFTA